MALKAWQIANPCSTEKRCGIFVTNASHLLIVIYTTSSEESLLLKKIKYGKNIYYMEGYQQLHIIYITKMLALTLVSGNTIKSFFPSYIYHSECSG